MGKLGRLLRTLRIYGFCKRIQRAIAPLSPRAARHRSARLKFYGSFVKAGDLCFDVGANEGNRTEILLELGASVVAVEPQVAYVELLRKRFRNHQRLAIKDVALGERNGECEMLVCSVGTASSMSPEWIRSVRLSGRFPELEWSKKTMVQVTTMDELIMTHGIPVFCKIDVEGYEFEVIKGLSRPIPVLSFEFTPEHLSPAINCIRRLQALGDYDFNYSLGESMTLCLDSWVAASTIEDSLTSLPDKRVFGDVYARLRRL